MPLLYSSPNYRAVFVLPMLTMIVFGLLGAIDDWEGIRGPPGWVCAPEQIYPSGNFCDRHSLDDEAFSGCFSFLLACLFEPIDWEISLSRLQFF